jgi:hypothetical protein
MTHFGHRVLGPALLLCLASLAEAADPAPAYPDHAKLLEWRDAGGWAHAVRTAKDWEIRRAHILAHMQEVMGSLPDDSRKLPLDLREVETHDCGTYVRRKVTLAAETGDRLPAFLLVPKSRAGRLPAVICLHPTSRELGKAIPAGLGGPPDQHYAADLAERGYVALAPDYVNMGEYRFDAYRAGYASASMKGIWNHMRCVDLLRSLPEVDGERIGVIGHSLGGHNAAFLAAFDGRVKCVVSSCGFCSFPTYMKGNLAGWSHDGYMPRIRTLYHLDPAQVPFDFGEVLAAIAPRAFLASAPEGDTNFDAQGVRDCIAAARPVYELLGAGNRLKAVYPSARHEFPADARRTAYAWMDEFLKN